MALVNPTAFSVAGVMVCEMKMVSDGAGGRDCIVMLLMVRVTAIDCGLEAALGTLAAWMDQRSTTT
jgi:hypothetical protein